MDDQPLLLSMYIYIYICGLIEVEVTEELWNGIALLAL